MYNDNTTKAHEVARKRNAAIAPPYVSFNTFRTLLTWLASEGVPLRFDRSFWQAKFSGSTGTQLMAALRFLGLLEGDRPMPELERLVNAPRQEKRVILAELLMDCYSVVPFDELPRATPSMVRGWFGGYPVDGHTMRKALSFFVNASKEAGIPISNAVSKMARIRTPTRTRGTPTEGRASLTVTTSDRRDLGVGIPLHTGGPSLRGRQPNQTTIALDSGGTVALTLAVDLFRLSERDREFVLKLVDLTRGYIERQGDAGTPEDDTAGGE